MYCAQCGSKINADARFCSACGTEIVPIKGKKNNIHNQQGPNIESNKHVEQGNTVIQEFLYFVSESVKSPMRASRNVTKTNLSSVMITYLFFSLTLSLFTYLLSNSFTSSFLGLGEIPFIFVVVTLFFFIVIFLAVYTGIIFGVTKIMQLNSNYIQVMIRLGVFMVIPLVLLLLAILTSFATATTFSFILFGAAVGLFFVSSYLTVFSVKEDASVGLDVYHGVILVTIANAIILFIIEDSVMSNLFDQILIELLL